MSDKIIYTAAVYSSVVNYVNFKGEAQEVQCQFSMNPIQLMTIISKFQPKKVKSGNPALNGQVEAMTDEQQLEIFRTIASRAAGEASEDGESWTPWINFEESLAGMAFMTKLASSDGDRKEFAEKVILDPIRAYVGYAVSDESNTEKDIKEFNDLLSQMEKLFLETPAKAAETPAERRARLQAELDATPDED